MTAARSAWCWPRFLFLAPIVFGARTVIAWQNTAVWNRLFGYHSVSAHFARCCLLYLLYADSYSCRVLRVYRWIYQRHEPEFAAA